MYVLVKFLFLIAVWPFFFFFFFFFFFLERDCPFGFLLVVFWLWSRCFGCVLLSLWCLGRKVLGNCIDSWSICYQITYGISLWQELSSLSKLLGTTFNMAAMTLYGQLWNNTKPMSQLTVQIAYKAWKGPLCNLRTTQAQISLQSTWYKRLHCSLYVLAGFDKE